ncbi:bacterial bifunctional deaminase-reductase [Nadsonia fulvescens var. elongata DSM 6958]|uniref:2,5-diamino-6-ribosylamino-4(3H)-pyrimidinone 5'-phosphate reductase n=1 Tax=Nadsonia fulvescens var. elongata DSM 6958 TaxID=857566 RepID=A0A1E3PT82_9ASCO|nr:bacterial bifunctional deaminase-reductase [Nadsonia fulvescens var. elongata DSM 6958]
MTSLIPLPSSLEPFLDPYLPSGKDSSSRLNSQWPFITLTYACSLDSRIAIAKGQQTVISHLETKTMTHYIRSKHDAILVGVGTVLADNPGLNCRYQAASKIRPVIIDPSFKTPVVVNGQASRLIRTARDHQGLGPFVVIGPELDLSQSPIREKVDIIQQVGGKVIQLKSYDQDNSNAKHLSWNDILARLKAEGLASVMIEGGAVVINHLLSVRPSLVDSLIITIGPVFLGENGVQVSPYTDLQLTDVEWWKGSRDVVLAARVGIA